MCEVTLLPHHPFQAYGGGATRPSWAVDELKYGVCSKPSFTPFILPRECNGYPSNIHPLVLVRQLGSCSTYVSELTCSARTKAYDVLVHKRLALGHFLPCVVRILYG